ncbi:CaiB/BaiF CoA transferase family protein [Rhizorhabdus dicambivorans]|uniref:CoA transferase n=1 Tax=Rhizorhabdus dicambivorans TaxID=1850238 RepID=A0A2A4FXG1_9SPHN|nr:CoA transferase [Rhizorhabdus dicambivorans]ATE66160.1 CoA transferase [Rhizorhabdus dicambivorans]PCE42086.1 CoA transferase [Rhizorhabdus dicambivorans]
MTTALDGFRVLDLSHALAGPSATKLLGDFGAEIIKVEAPEKGDFTRTLVPWVFDSFNRNKKSIAVDLKSAEGQQLVRDLARVCDVVVQSFRPGVVESLGLGREDLAAINPRLIYVSFSGFGQTGPDAARKGVDALLQSETGMALMQGGLLGSLSFVDQAGGLALSGAIMASLLKRERTGEIDHVEMSLFEVGLYLQTAPILECSVTGKMLDQTGHGSRYPLNGIFEAADGPLYMGLYWDSDWKDFCELAGRLDVHGDARFATPADRAANLEALHAAVHQMLQAHPRRYWIDGLEARGVLAGEVRTHNEVLESDQVRRNRSIERLPTSRGAIGAYVKAPARVVGRDRPDATPAPRVGEHTDAILDILGLSAEKKTELRERGVVG